MMVVFSEKWLPLIHCAIHEAVETIKSPLCWPLIKWPSRACVVHGGEVPLSYGERVVPDTTENFWHHRCVLRYSSSISGVAHVVVCKSSHTYRVVITTC